MAADNTTYDLAINRGYKSLFHYVINASSAIISEQLTLEMELKNKKSKD